jgi:multiple sugar transport system ATP-binding protein
MRLEIKKLHDELKSTIVYVTHDQIEAMTMATRIAVMNAGVIQQVGTPDEIYGNPQNLFVAGFIGSPAMNLREGKIAAKNGMVRATVGGLELMLDKYPFAARPADGQAIVVGLRPEHFGEPDEALANSAMTFELPVQYTEKTGSDATGYLKFGDNSLLAVRMDPERVGALKQGTPIRVSFPQSKLHVFDAQSGRRL